MTGRRKKFWLSAVFALVLAVFGAFMIPTGDTYADDGDPINDCMSSGASQSLGWVMCPILGILDGASDSLYNTFLKPALQVDPQLFTQETSGGKVATKQGWDIFRNIANSLFVILLLAVIFSQLTGVGIDNYGIKKILPKLIVSAILVNLSYWICIALVDVSNILGNSLQAMFDNIAKNINLDGANAGGITFEGLAATGASTVFVPAVILTALFAGIWALGGVQGVLVMLVVAAVSVVVALAFLFLLLAVREAAIVVLVMISPLAFVCYMLPNTKNLFDRWLKIGQALLLVYPICGLMVGGGNFVSRVLLAAGMGSDSLFPALAAMIVGIVPIFFVPMVLKNSFQGLGNLGAKISGMGQRVGNRLSGNAGKVMQNSDRVQRLSNKLDSSRFAPKTVRAAAAEREAKRLAAASKRNTIGTREGYSDFVATSAAGLEAKEDAQKVADTESMLAYGRMDENGVITNDTASAVNVNDTGSVGRFYANALARHQQALASGDHAAAQTAFSQVKAAQNILSKTDKGRAEVQNILADSARNATTDKQADGVKMAASHLMSNYGDTYKAKNRGANDMITELATAGAGAAGISGVQAKLGGSGVGAYAASGAKKYTAESIANADDQALDNIASSIASGSLNNSDADPEHNVTGSLDSVRNSAYEALHNDNIHLKPEVEDKLKTIVGDYVPPEVTRAQVAGEAAGGAAVTGEGGTVVAAGATATVSDGDAVSGAGDTFTAQTAGGEQTFIRQENGRWQDENGNDMGGEFSVRVEQNPKIQQQIQENARKNDMYRKMSDEKILDLATQPNPKSQAVQNSAVREANRRGLNR